MELVAMCCAVRCLFSCFPFNKDVEESFKTKISMEIKSILHSSAPGGKAFSGFSSSRRWCCTDTHANCYSSALLVTVFPVIWNELLWNNSRERYFIHWWAEFNKRIPSKMPFHEYFLPSLGPLAVKVERDTGLVCFRMQNHIDNHSSMNTHREFI